MRISNTVNSDSMAALALHTNDNVVICIRSLSAGEEVLIDGQPAKMAVALGIGHKIARRTIREGEPIVKYGIIIGTATADIPRGDHIHTHNMKSNYIPTYLNE
jgi:altronate dehydratase small subunit